MDIKEISKRYVYITDKGQFYDRQQRKYFSELQIRKKVIYWQLTAGQGQSLDLDAYINSLKVLGLTSDEIINRTGRPSARARLGPEIQATFEALKPKLRLFKQGMPPLLYRKNESGELRHIGPFDEDTFRDAITSDYDMLTTVQHELLIRDDLADVDTLGLIKELYRHFSTDASLLLRSQPALISWNASEPAFKILDPTVLKQAPHPAWDEFLARLDFPETFKAYVWSIFEPTNFGRQALWLQGEGNDGKSTVLRAIANFMGPEHTLTIGIGSYDRDFFFGDAFGKRLAIYPDCKNLSVLRKERIKSLLGKDIVSINNKYEKVFSAQVYSKLLVASNWLPQINYNDDSERTRLLLVRVKSTGLEFGDPDFESKLSLEMGAFLNSCYESYTKECPNNMSLRVPLSMQQTIQVLCSALDSDLLEQFINERLEFGPGFSVRKSELNRALKDFFSANWATQGADFSFNDLNRMLGKRGVTNDISENGGRNYIGVRLASTKMAVVK